MYRIGEISNICNVSQKTLRFYEKKGLLKPALVNNDTGYRYYDDESIKTIENIKKLKAIGMSLKEIKDFDFNKQNLDAFIDQKLKNSQKTLHTLFLFDTNSKGEIIMKNFINDEDALGKWNYIGSTKSIDGEIENEPFFLDEIYFLENGQGYWLVNGWSKGELYIYPNEYPIPETCHYEIRNDKLYVSIPKEDSNDIQQIAVYSRVDRKKYKLEDMAKKDNIDLKFKCDKEILGIWKGVAVISEPEKFSPTDKNFPSFIYDYNFKEDGSLIVRFTDGRVFNQKWTKGFCINLLDEVTPKYKLKDIDNIKYLFVENRNGDYIYNGRISSYFVFRRK